MKQNIFKITGVAIILCLWMTSCVNDEGNYNYEKRENVTNITIEGVEQMIAVTIGKSLEIKPNVTGLLDDADYEFLWYVYADKTADADQRKAVRDTLSRKKDLSTIISMKADNYNLVYEIKDTRNQVRTYSETKISVHETDMNVGLYVLKDDGEKSDFDYFGFYGDVVYRDALKNQNEDCRVDGLARRIANQEASYSHRQLESNGTYTLLQRQNAIHITTTKEAVSLNANNLSQTFKRFDDMFYEQPEEGFMVEDFYRIQAEYKSLYMINGGKFYAMVNVSTNYGIFSNYRGYRNDTIRVAPEIYCVYWEVVVYDKKSRKFFWASTDAGDNNYYEFTNWVQPAGTDLELVRLLQGSVPRILQGTADGKAIFKDRNSSDYYYATLSHNLNEFARPKSNPVKSCSVLPAGSKLSQSTVLAATEKGKFIYYADDNKLMAAFDPQTGKKDDKLIYTFPAGEKITLIRMSDMNAPKSTGNPFYLIVLTNHANGWKLYQYNLADVAEPEVADIVATYEGEGNAKEFSVRYSY